MGMKFVNRICPNCKNPNYIVSLGDFSTAYKYKCMNCNGYFNDIDFGEPLQPVWLKDRMNKKVDMVEVVRCKDCKYWQDNNGGYPHRDCKWNQYETPDPDDFCSGGERRNDDA